MGIGKRFSGYAKPLLERDNRNGIPIWGFKGYCGRIYTVSDFSISIRLKILLTLIILKNWTLLPFQDEDQAAENNW